MLRFGLIFLFFLSSIFAFGQQVLTGKVTNVHGEPVNGAILSIRDLDESLVLAYGLSNEMGQYNMKVNHENATVLLEVSFLGYAKQSIAIDNKTAVYDFILQISTEELKEVVIKSAPVYQIKDTINYDVGEFTSAQDRVIGDILKKLPGIETLSDGQILYQGKPIQKYYINGLDLLEGRYRIANDNLPVDAVKKVQIIENDQPLKILDSLVFSDRASLNIQLKKFTTTGSAKLGAGVGPFIREVNVTPMTFHRSFQTIYSFQSNNIGDPVSRQLRGFYDQTTYQEGEYLKIQAVPRPPFDEKRWLDNSINLGSINVLKKLQNEMEIKGNLSYYNDYQKRGGNVITTIFTPDQEIQLAEYIDNRYSLDHLRGSITAVKNTRKLYFENRTQFQNEWKANLGDLLQESDEAISQTQRTANFGLDNSFSATTRWGDQLIQIGSVITFSRNPESLKVSPGQFEETLSEGTSYDQLGQYVKQSNFLVDNYLGLTKGFKRFILSPRFGLFYQDQKMTSTLGTILDSQESLLRMDFHNDIRFINRKAYARLQTQYELNDLKAELFLPFTFQSYTIARQNESTRNNRGIAEPRLNLNYEPHPYWKFASNIFYTDQLGEIDQLYSSYILTSYRQLQKFNGLIPESSILSSTISVSYKNPLKSFFANLNFSQSREDRNFIYNTVIDDRGLSTLELVQLNNEGASQSIGADLSKYIYSLKTTFKIAWSMSFNENDFIVNEQKALQNSENYKASFMASYNRIRFLSVVYDTRLSLFQSRIEKNEMDEILLFEHDLQVDLFPLENHNLSLDAEYFKSNATSQNVNQLFLNASYRLTLPKKRIDLAIECNNLLNAMSYSSFYNSAYSILKTTYSLRPRQFLLKVAFNFN